MMPNSDLFRREAVEHHRQRLYGEVVLTMPTTHWAVTAIVAVVVALILGVLAFGSYARKETIGGWVRPDRGVVRVQAQDEGVVENVAVSEGQQVDVGATLLTLRLDPDVAKGESFGQRVVADLAAERKQLEDQLAASRAQFEVREARLAGELVGLDREIRQYKLRHELLEKRVALAQRQHDERTSLVKQGFLSKLDAERLEDAVLAARQAREEQVQDLVQRENKANSTRYELAALPHERRAVLAAVGERLALLDQRLTEAGRRSKVVLTAPVAGRIASVRVEPGEAAKAKSALVDILPAGSGLQVELFAPSRSAGFLSEGTEVQLRYDAFPYQKFGVSKGRIIRVSRSTMDAKELPRSLSADEPVYRAIVALDQPHVLVDGRIQPLQAGMTLKADLILERRRVGEYLFAPLFGAARRG
jgi:membrane fusion protein